MSRRPARVPNPATRGQLHHQHRLVRGPRHSLVVLVPAPPLGRSHAASAIGSGRYLPG
jgi:hypothetical protein